MATRKSRITTKKNAVMPIYYAYLALYLSAMAYGFVSYYIGEGIVVICAISIGILSIPFYVIAIVAPPLVACIVGYFSRWSAWSSCLLGFPLLVLVSAVTPFCGRCDTLGLPVPWLALYDSKPLAAAESFDESIHYRLPYYAAIFVVSFIIGRAHRYYLKRKTSKR